MSHVGGPQEEVLEAMRESDKTEMVELAAVRRAIQEISVDHDREDLATVGHILRDRYMIPDVRSATGMSLAQIMNVKQEAYEVRILKGQLAKIVTHLEAHRKDYAAKKKVPVLKAKIARLSERLARAEAAGR